MVNKDRSNRYKNLRRLFLEQMVKIPKPIELEINSPHQVTLVLIESEQKYRDFLKNNGLSRNSYRYLYNPDQLRGLGWDSAYLLRVGQWDRSPLLRHEDGHWMLDTRFPGWKD